MEVFITNKHASVYYLISVEFKREDLLFVLASPKEKKHDKRED